MVDLGCFFVIRFQKRFKNCSEYTFRNMMMELGVLSFRQSDHIWELKLKNTYDRRIMMAE
jgi:hypothetical protein